MISSHDHPCIEMYNGVTYNVQDRAGFEPSKIKIIYKEKHYQEIVYEKGFGFEMLWSGIGGFVGIFLGYSMMQLPEFLGRYF